MDAARKLAGQYGAEATATAEIINDPSIDAVLVATSTDTHSDLIEAATAAGKAVLCEKPVDLSLERARACQVAAAKNGRPVMIGFNRRFDPNFAALKVAVDRGEIGKTELLSVTSFDPAPPPVSYVKVSGGLFCDMMIHDFDTLLWLNPNTKPIEVTAIADALVRPAFADKGFHDTAVVTIRFNNGSIAVAEANFSATYGYDIRGEVFGSGGMAMMGDVRRSSMTLYDRNGVSNDTWRRDTDHFVHGYTAQLASFVDAVRTGTVTGPKQWINSR